jgi:23S rRNA (cytosine1962-C5)-methyltransferase/23S rRNA (guanine2445-N2)-methyltransferase / 23S rRNA (guanine2069-N7)-methyltransferase
MEDYSIIYNRLKKNYKKLNKLLKNKQVTAYRLYEKDIPEYPYIVDVYNDCALIFEKGKLLDHSDKEQLELHLAHKNNTVKAVCELLDIKTNRVILKTRLVQQANNVFEALKKAERYFSIHENGMKFKVNLVDHLETGLYLDQRSLRKIIKETAKDKKVLNLFSYTGAASVAAAIGGGNVTTMDMSNTYLEWARENFQLNKLDEYQHTFIKADVLQYIKNLRDTFDIIILDPPSFSKSKSMQEDFNVQDFHVNLIMTLMKHLTNKGVLYFTHSFSKFKLDSSLEERYQIKDITYKTIPEDFRNKKIHQCFEIRKK